MPHSQLNIYFMVTQKLISLKVDQQILADFDALCSSIGTNRNNLINFAMKATINNLSSWQMCKLVVAYDKARCIL